MDDTSPLSIEEIILLRALEKEASKADWIHSTSPGQGSYDLTEVPANVPKYFVARYMKRADAVFLAELRNKFERIMAMVERVDQLEQAVSDLNSFDAPEELMKERKKVHELCLLLGRALGLIDHARTAQPVAIDVIRHHAKLLYRDIRKVVDQDGVPQKQTSTESAKPADDPSALLARAADFVSAIRFIGEGGIPQAQADAHALWKDLRRFDTDVPTNPLPITVDAGGILEIIEAWAGNDGWQMNHEIRAKCAELRRRFGLPGKGGNEGEGR